MTGTEINAALTERLTNSGYSDAQARQIMSMATRMSRGADVRITQGWVTVSDVERTARTLAECRANPQDARRIIATSLSPRGPERSVQLAAVPRRVLPRRYSYEVTIEGQRYEVETSREFRSTGMTTLEGSRAGRLRQALLHVGEADSPITGVFRVSSTGRRTAIYAVTEGGRRLGLEGKNLARFQQAYYDRYATMARQFASGRDPQQLILIQDVTAMRRAEAERARTGGA